MAVVAVPKARAIASVIPPSIMKIGISKIMHKQPPLLHFFSMPKALFISANRTPIKTPKKNEFVNSNTRGRNKRYRNIISLIDFLP